MTDNEKLNASKNKRLQRERNHRRYMIAEIAETKFIQSGYEETKIDEIALEAGYTKATIYNYFESKLDIFAAVLSNAYQELNLLFEKKLGKSSPSFEVIGEIYLEFAQKFPNKMDFMNSCLGIYD